MTLPLFLDELNQTPECFKAAPPMARNTKPRIKFAPGHRRDSRTESIHEFSAVVEGRLIGGLIAMRHMPDGTLRLDIYRTDPGLTVTLPGNEHKGPPVQTDPHSGVRFLTTVENQTP